jgi:hypothetical protein
MKSHKSCSAWLMAAIAVYLVLVAERPVHAYIDPGTGSLIYQTALTLLLGAGLVLRRARGSIARFVKRLGGRGAGPESPGAEP